MTNTLPLLVFPQARTLEPPKGSGFPPDMPHLPSRGRQVVRLMGQLSEVQQSFERYKASVGKSMAGLEPETVLVIEIAGSVEDFKQAIDATGLEWLGEWDIDELSPDDDFYIEPKIGVDFFKKNVIGVNNRQQSKDIRQALMEHQVIDESGRLTGKSLDQIMLPAYAVHLFDDIQFAIEQSKSKMLSGRLFVSMGNERAMQDLLSLWEQWRQNQELPLGKTKWRDVFNQMVAIRRWGIQETLRETGMIDAWKDFLAHNATQSIRCQIELFYRRAKAKRAQVERNLVTMIQAGGGRVLGNFIDMPEIAFHAVKVELSSQQIRDLLADLASDSKDTDIQLFKFHGVMYFRPTGQSLSSIESGDGIDSEIPEEEIELPPVAAIFDGAPNLQHSALKGRLLFDDPDNLSAEYQPGERKHGTAMASLVIHGDIADAGHTPLSRLVYAVSIMQPDPHSDPQNRTEHIPDDVFFEDRIARAVRRMFEGEGNVPPQAASVCVINLSIGDPLRPFIHTPSPWAKLLDWLSWRYRVLFCVSAGNYIDNVDIGITVPEFLSLSPEKKVEHTLQTIQEHISRRRILSPAESINAITVGALHLDLSGNYYAGQRTDLLPNSSIFSPITRFGHGFRRSIKPEILFPGGRQLFRTPVLDSQTNYIVDRSIGAPGLKIAWDSNQAGSSSQTAYSRGTSNATALATRSAARIYDVLDVLRTQHNYNIPQGLMSVLIKALLVHGAKQEPDAIRSIDGALKNSAKSGNFKEIVSRYLGYGAVDIERVLACTEQRATVLGCGEIHENEVHEYRFPLPPGLSGLKAWRRMVVTLAWFSPINPEHRNVREAKLNLSPAKKWNEIQLQLTRKGADHNQVLRGTVQHEVVEGSNQISVYQDGTDILLHVTCKKDATANLDVAIPYGLAVTLEVAEGTEVAIYEQLRTRLMPQIAVGAAGQAT